MHPFSIAGGFGGLAVAVAVVVAAAVVAVAPIGEVSA